MPITNIDTVHRQVTRDLAGTAPSTPHQIPDPQRPGETKAVNFRLVHAPVEEKNPATERYPGISLRILKPRRNTEWNTVENQSWREPDPDDAAAEVIKTAPPPRSWWLDYRISVYAKTQAEFSDVCSLLHEIWDVGRDQTAITFTDEDTTLFPGVTHTAQVRLTQLADRFRPQDNVFMADYMVTIPVSVIRTGAVETKPPVEEFIISVENTRDDAGDTEEQSSTTSIALDGGDAQSGTADTELAEPVTILVLDHLGAPAPNRRVGAAANGGGSITAEAYTDADGLASFLWTLGPSGAQTADFSLTGATGSPVQATATIT